jgi:hypothetical protein
MVGTLENPTLDLNPALPETLDVITATRAGTATYTDVNGLIATAPANTVRVDQTQGAELTPTKFQNIGYTDFSSGRVLSNFGTGVSPVLSSDALGSPSGTEDAYKIVFNAGSGTTSGDGSELYFNVSEIEDNIQSTASIFLRGENGGEQLVFRGASNGSYQLVTLTTEWQRFTTTENTSPSGNQKFTFGIRQSVSGHGVINSAATVYAYGPQLEEGTTASDFVANTTGSPKFITGATFGPRVPMILVEPSATNSFLYSQPTSALAFGGGGIRTFDAATAPNGETEAFRITNNGTSGNHNYRATSSITFGSDSMVLSVWAKAGSGGNNYFTWSFQNLGGAVVRAGFKLEGDGETQIITNGNGGHTLQIETYPDGWYRCIIIGNTQSSGTTTQFLYTVSGYTEHSSIAGGSVLLWGFQVESGSVATSYIPTSGSTVTRAADDLEISGSAFDFYNGSEGTFYMELIDKNILDSTSHLYLHGGGNNLILYSNGNSANVANYDGANFLQFSGIPSNQLIRMALSYASSTKKLSVNGNTSSDSPYNGNYSGISSLYLGTNLSGHIKRVLFWPYSSDRL